jgi:PAS domain S-box-containing protein
MRRSRAAVGARPSFADPRVRLRRVTTNGVSPWLKREWQASIEPRRDALHPMTILYALEQTQAIVGSVDGRIIHWGRGAERLYGWTANEAIGCRVGDLLEQQGAGASDASALDASGSRVWKGELSRVHKDGRELSIAAHRVSGRDFSGRATVIELGSLIEPAERDADPPASRVQQTEANGCPTHRIAHDFKNLLGIITLNLEFARECTASGGELRKLIDEALAAAWQGSELTSRLADSARRQPA